MIMGLLSLFFGVAFLCVGFLVGEVVRWRLPRIWAACPRKLLREAFMTGLVYSLVAMIICAIIGVFTKTEAPGYGSFTNMITVFLIVWILTTITWQAFVLAYSAVAATGGISKNLGIIARSTIGALTFSLIILLLMK